jgi:hypothetical protein
VRGKERNVREMRREMNTKAICQKTGPSITSDLRERERERERESARPQRSRRKSYIIGTA